MGLFVQKLTGMEGFPNEITGTTVDQYIISSGMDGIKRPFRRQMDAFSLTLLVTTEVMSHPLQLSAEMR